MKMKIQMKMKISVKIAIPIKIKNIYGANETRI